MKTLYRNAVQTLQPSRAEMDRRLAPHRALHSAAKVVAQHLITETGKSATELYRAHCADRVENETPLDKEVRIVLLGYARREKI